MNTFSILVPALLLLAGCSTVEPHKYSGVSTETTNSPFNESLPDGLQTLRAAGLLLQDEYENAEFIENSDRTMIVATVRAVPCRLVFRHIKTKDGDYWLPNQIGCDGQISSLNTYSTE